MFARKLSIQRIDERGERHRSAGMPGLGLLHRIDGQRANRVYAKQVEIDAGF